MQRCCRALHHPSGDGAPIRFINLSVPSGGPAGRVKLRHMMKVRVYVKSLTTTLTYYLNYGQHVFSFGLDALCIFLGASADYISGLHPAYL